MKKKIKYADAPEEVAESISLSERIDDFLPPPDRLIRKFGKVKITITLDSESVAFFKASAKKNNVKYQTMINEVLSSTLRDIVTPFNNCNIRVVHAPHCCYGMASPA